MPTSRPPRNKPGAYRPRSSTRKSPPQTDSAARATTKAPARKTAPAQGPLDAAQKRYLRGFAHDLKPVILIGQKGVTEAVVAELDGALNHHELVKVRLGDDDRDARAAALDAIAMRVAAEIVQSIGKVASLYRRNPDKAQFDGMPSSRKGSTVRPRTAQ